jgi:TolB-like protein
MNVRVGIHVGDIVLDDGDVYGDGVNVASRLESMSPVGGICVSNTVYDELRNKKDFDGVELGLQSLKGVGRLIEIYGLKGDLLTEPKPSDYQDNKIAVHSDDEVPSIAIIPFENKGADEDVFYAYGISADLISDCSSAGLIRVAGLKDIENLDYKNLQYDELASKLFVRYVSHGSLWKRGDLFQLSIELYDTKDKKVIWSDRWEEKWDNLPIIKEYLSDGLLKSLSTKPKEVKKSDNINTQAYEYYLKGKYRLKNAETIEDKEIVRGLLQKAIELEDTLMDAKEWLSWLYVNEGDFVTGMEIFSNTLKQADELGVKRNMGSCLEGIGFIYFKKGDFNNALKYLERALKIFEKLEDKSGMTSVLLHICVVCSINGNLDKAFDFNMRQLEICKETDDKRGVGITNTVISQLYWRQGDLDKALEHGIHALEIIENFGWKWDKYYPLCLIGTFYMDKGDFDRAIEYLEQSYVIQKDIGDKDILLATTKYLFLAYKHVGKEFDEVEIHNLIKETEFIDWEDNYRLYYLFEDTSYLETADKQIQELADNLEPDVKAKFLSYPIPKAIVEEWEKVK